MQSLKVVCEYICSVLDRKGRELKYLFLAIKLQSVLIIRAILQVASILKSKLKLK